MVTIVAKVALVFVKEKVSVAVVVVVEVLVFRGVVVVKVGVVEER
jgi:hypothetical protein